MCAWLLRVCYLVKVSFHVNVYYKRSLNIINGYLNDKKNPEITGTIIHCFVVSNFIIDEATQQKLNFWCVLLENMCTCRNKTILSFNPCKSNIEQHGDKQDAFNYTANSARRILKWAAKRRSSNWKTVVNNVKVLLEMKIETKTHL